MIPPHYVIHSSLDSMSQFLFLLRTYILAFLFSLILKIHFASLQSLSHCSCLVTKSCLILCDLMDCSMPGFRVLHNLLEFAETHVHWVTDAIQPSHPLSSPSPAFNLSQHQGPFQWVGSSQQVAKYWSFSFNIRTSNAYSGLISFRIDWFDFLAV